MIYSYKGTKIEASSRKEAISKIIADKEDFSDTSSEFRLAIYKNGFLEEVHNVKLKEALSLYKKLYGKYHRGATPEKYSIDNLRNKGNDGDYPIEFVIEKRKKLSAKEVVELRKEISFGSVYYADYKNSFGVDKQNCLDFFDGYNSMLSENSEKESDESLKDYYDSNTTALYAYVNFKTGKVENSEK